APRVLIAAPGSGSGKTLVTCGILRLLQKKGFSPVAFKCGPDYIDPMFHRQVLGIPSRNLDTFFSPDGQTLEILQKAVRKNKADIAIIEGVMGYFDGTGKTGMEASSFDLAMQTQTPVILLVNAKGMGRSIVSLIKGF
ncbi:MAG TPA: cobyrinic acid a,c-diamide synthase, partial [Sarcina sp.]|nr:cobyrinic acid a,c-diamide synthase [Sarcina sp.]